MSESKRPCPICGDLMKAWSCKKYCSDKCRMKGYRLRKKYTSMTITERTRGVLSARCDNCGEKIRNPRIGQKHCSPKCKQAMYRQNKKFANEPEGSLVQLKIPESAYTITNSL